MVIDINEIIQLLKEIEWLQSEQRGLEEDDIDWIAIQFEINSNYSTIEYLKEILRSGG